jgi:hypothetical protein
MRSRSKAFGAEQITIVSKGRTPDLQSVAQEGQESRPKRASIEARRGLGRASTGRAAQIWFLPLASDHQR